MDTNTALEKIKKLLALAKSDNPNEAEAALRQARKLMDIHQLDMAEIHASQACEEFIKTGTKMDPPVWMWRLAQVCSYAFGTEVISHGAYIRGWDCGGFEFRFIGVDIAPSLSKYAFEVLNRQLQISRRDFVTTQTRCKLATKRRRGDEFANAWIDAVYRKVADFAGIDEQNVQAITAYKAQKYPNLKSTPLTRRPTHGRDLEARKSGVKAGKSAQLNHGVAGEQQTLIGSC